MRYQKGFTLIEIAIVLVIIGLLLGGVLKGQELITSARVRNLISTQDGIKAAYFGFLDRFRALPGDYPAAFGNINGVPNTNNGNGNGRIETGGTATATVVANEDILVWEHLSKSGFINGTYSYGALGPDTNPTNPYGIYMQLIYDGAYGGTPPSALRHNLKTGSQVPVDIITEVDRKIDDGKPNTGGFQISVYAGNGGAVTQTGTNGCASGTGAADTWNAINGNTNCGGASLF